MALKDEGIDVTSGTVKSDLEAGPGGVKARLDGESKVSGRVPISRKLGSLGRLLPYIGELPPQM